MAVLKNGPNLCDQKTREACHEKNCIDFGPEIAHIGNEGTQKRVAGQGETCESIAGIGHLIDAVAENSRYRDADA